MSRHRHVRNMRLDDYDDHYSTSSEEDLPLDEQASQYLWNPNANNNNAQIPPETQLPAQDDDLLSDLASQFRTVLNDATLQESDIDAAILAANYDVDTALAMLRSRAEVVQSDNRAAAGQLELETPSAIGELVGEEVCPEQALEMPPRVDTEVTVEIESGTVLRIEEGEDVVPFAFDKPSPDDLIKMKQGAGGARARKLRMPKASALKRGEGKKEAPKKDDEEEEGKKEEKKGDLRKHVRTAKDVLEKKQEEVTEEVKVVKEVKQRSKPIDISNRVSAGCKSVSVVVAGHVDAGKSTLLGHLLKLLGSGESRSGKKGRKRRDEFDLAWGTDVDEGERERGVTIDIATRVFKHGARSYAMIDAPGHRDFVPAMILGACQASAALLVLDASPGEFEAGFSEEGQTREHALVLKSLGVHRLIVVVNKMDVARFDKERFEEVVKVTKDFLKGNGWKTTKNVEFVAASGREGVNLVRKPEQGHPILNWYEGKTILDALKELPAVHQSLITETSGKPTRLIVSNQFRSESLGGRGAVTGRLLCGSIAPKDKLVVCPGTTIATVKSIEVGKGERCEVAVAGVDSLPVSLGLLDLTDGQIITPGSVLCDPEARVAVAVEFRAQIVTLTTWTPLIAGSRGVLHIGGGSEAAAITKLVEYVGGRKGGKTKRPRRLIKGDIAVVEITCEREVALEKFAEVKGLGRFAFRQEGRTVAVGIVVEVVR